MKLFKNRFVDAASFYLFLILAKMLYVLPEGLTYSLCKGVGIILYHVMGKRRGLAEHHLRMVYQEWPEEKIRKTLKAVFQNMALVGAEFILLPKIRAKHLDNDFEIIGLNNLDNALEKGRGVILVTAHLGNWEVGGLKLASMGYKVQAIMREQSQKRINEYLVREREKYGLKLIVKPVPLYLRLKERGMVFKDESADKKIKAALARNEIVAMVADQNGGKRGLIIDFMGFPASTVAGPAVYARKTGACILPGFIFRQGRYRFRIVFEPALVPDNHEDDEDFLKAEMQRINTIIERNIHERPEQWLWVHRRWEPVVYGKG